MLGFFIHHNPVESGRRPRLSEGTSVIKGTLDAAHEAFGYLSANWKFPGVSALCSGYNCAKCSTPSTNCDN